VKPAKPAGFPKSVSEKLKTMNEELRAKAAEKTGKNKTKFAGGAEEDLVYIGRGDVADKSLLKAGTQIQFKLYTDTKGVGGCDAIAA